MWRQHRYRQAEDTPRRRSFLLWFVIVYAVVCVSLMLIIPAAWHNG